MASVHHKNQSNEGVAARAPQPTTDNSGEPDLETWARSLLSANANTLGDEELAILRGQVEGVASTKPSAALPPPDPTTVTVVRNGRELKCLGKLLDNADAVAIDIETSSLDPRAGEIVGIGLSVDNANVYVPTSHRHKDGERLLADQLPLEVVVCELHLGRLALVAHNAKFEFRWLRWHAGVTCQFAWDVMLAARLLASHLPADLKDLAARELDVPDWSLSNEELKSIQFLPVERVARYCAKDCRYTLDLYGKQRTCLS